MALRIRRIGRAGALTAALSLASLLSHPVLAQDSRDAYKDAIRAIESQDWQTAIALLRQAIEEQPEEKTGAFRRYLPHYYLGLSLYRLGNCTAALTVWAESEKQGVIKRLKEYNDLRQGKALCQKRVWRRQAQNQVDEVSGLAAGIAALQNQPELRDEWTRGEPSWVDRLEAVEDLLASARSLLERSDSEISPADLEQASANAVSAQQQLSVIQREARARLNEFRAQVDVRGRLIEMLLTEANEVLSATAYLEPFPPRIGELRSQVTRLIESARRAGEGATPEELEDLRLELSSALERLKRASVPPPQDLTRAAEAFLAADHSTVLEILQRASFADHRAAAHAHLFRAASLFALWVADGEKDPERLSQAAEAARDCRRQDTSLEPLARAFSPRFIEFFRREALELAPAPLPQIRE